MVNLLDARATTLMIPGIAGIGKTTIAAKTDRTIHASKESFSITVVKIGKAHEHCLNRLQNGCSTLVIPFCRLSCCYTRSQA